METWQFSLFFAALLLGYIVVHVRVARFEEYLRELGSLKSIDDRIGALAAQLPKAEPARLDRIEALLQQLHEDLEDLRETTAQVEEAVVQIPTPQQTAAAAAAAAPMLSPGERIAAVVELRLLQLGYTHLRLLTDLKNLPLDGDVEVQVECERRHMPAKGRVLLRNGAIRDLTLQTVAPTFP